MKIKNGSKLVLTDGDSDGVVSAIGSVFKDKEGEWLFNPADDWSLNDEQMQQIATLLEAIKDCDR